MVSRSVAVNCFLGCRMSYLVVLKACRSTVGAGSMSLPQVAAKKIGVQRDRRDEARRGGLVHSVGSSEEHT